MHLKSCFVLLWMFFSLVVQAQEVTFQNRKHRVGFIAGYGNQSMVDVAYHYEVMFFQGQYYYAFLNKKTWSVEGLIQPQYNLTRYRPINHISKVSHGYEAGLNVGVLIKKNILREHIGVYLLLSIGPHYVSGTPERQVEGFIFSDNIFVGLYVKITNQLYLDIRPGFRHISNANLNSPNGGVNTTIISGGFFLILP